MGSNEDTQLHTDEFYLKLPALQPPAGVIPRFDSPPNGNGLAIAVTAGAAGITTVAGLIRILTRLYCTKKVRFEDYLALLSFAFYISATVLVARITSEPGIFVHQWDLLFSGVEHFTILYVYTTILYCVTLMCIKTAILLEWINIFIPHHAHNTFWWICWAMIVANLILYTATIITINLICIPRQRIWRRWVPGTCINIDVFNIFIAIFNLIFDLLILVLPHRILWRLAITTKKKIGVSFVFSFGAFACVSAAGRVTSAVNMMTTRDTTYAYSRHLLWGLGETTSAHLVFCAPAIPIAFRQASPMMRLYRTLRSKMRLPGGGSRGHSSGSESRYGWPHDIITTTTSGGSVTAWEENSQVHLKPIVGGKDGGAYVKNVHNHTRNSSDPRSRQSEASASRARPGILRTTEIKVTCTAIDDSVPAADLQNTERSFLW
ncbi:putative ribosomal protein L36e [Rosellinia necatrix]|uniref:Putative ribosomal protein L36e n=1 Tax=Rosellinia necatrix TaxID=77044 RepID=A0A1W2TFR7_ROSNE|nr:putative ribosomal protein L36e [Rosellinia necatrix]